MIQKMRRIKAWQRQWVPVVEFGIPMKKWRPSRRDVRKRLMQSRRGYGTSNGRVWPRRTGSHWHGDLPPLRVDGHAYRRRTRRRR